MNQSQKLLSDIVVYTKYSRYRKDLKRRETWDEIIDRYVGMMLARYCGEEYRTQWKKKKVDVSKSPLAKEIIEKAEYLYNKDVLPSMRSLQFAGPAQEKNHARGYNCCYLPMNDYRAFSEVMFLLLGGTGVGYSVQYHHVRELPEVIKPVKERKYLVGDSIEGWADAVKALMKSYFGISKYKPRFDFSDIREKGQPLITAGGKAPGPDPLKICLAKIEALLNSKENHSKLTPLEVHDICCHIADAVLAGGIRRAAMIALFSFDDKEMATCKYGSWWELNPQRGRANNSAVIVRNRVKKQEFMNFWNIIQASGSGEPGISFTNDAEYGFNPCFVGETPLLTPTGPVMFKNLAGMGDVDLVNWKGDHVKGKVWSNGVKSTVSVRFTNGYEIRCTPDHQFMLNDGSVEYAKNLKGKRLQQFVEMKNEPNELFTKLGFIQGDGSISRILIEDHKGVEVYFGKKDAEVATLFTVEYNSENAYHYITGFNNTLKKLEFDPSPLPKRVFPKTYESWTWEQKFGFLRGLYSANGSVINARRISFKSTSKVLIEQLGAALAEFGIETYVTKNKPKIITWPNSNYESKESYDLNITQFNSVKYFAENIGFIQRYKNEALDHLIQVTSPVVSSVRDFGEREVFDFELYDDTHWGVVGNGVVAHNCHEVSLRPFQFCNLTEINAGTIRNQEDFNNRARVASFWGTLQAGFTDFHYLRPIWKQHTEKDALLGVGITGIANGNIENLDEQKAVVEVINENLRVSEIIGINPAARNTVIKPSGTTSCVVGTSSGIHAWHSKYYIRNMQCAVGDDLYNYFTLFHPELIKEMDFQPGSAVIGIPMKAPEHAILRDDESAIQFLERVRRYNEYWVQEGHVSGPNYNNVSATVNIKPEEWDEVGEWMWKNRNFYSGISVIPYDGGTYADAPFQECSEYEYQKRMKMIRDNPIDLTSIQEYEDNTNLTGELSCAGGKCEISY